MANLLFICSKNQWRSPTAERLFRNHPEHYAKSAGTSTKARIRVNEKLIKQADKVFVMEQKHKTLILQRFPEACNGKSITVMEIEDHYQFGDPELISLLEKVLEHHL